MTCSATGRPTVKVKLTIKDKNMQISDENKAEGINSASLYHLFDMADNNSLVTCTASIVFRGKLYRNTLKSYRVIVRNMNGSPVGKNLQKIQFKKEVIIAKSILCNGYIFMQFAIIVVALPID